MGAVSKVFRIAGSMFDIFSLQFICHREKGQLLVLYKHVITSFFQLQFKFLCNSFFSLVTHTSKRMASLLTDNLSAQNFYRMIKKPLIIIYVTNLAKYKRTYFRSREFQIKIFFYLFGKGKFKIQQNLDNTQFMRPQNDRLLCGITNYPKTTPPPLFDENKYQERNYRDVVYIIILPVCTTFRLYV